MCATVSSDYSIDNPSIKYQDGSEYLIEIDSSYNIVIADINQCCETRKLHLTFHRV